MTRKTKRQQQVSKISRKKGRFISQDQFFVEELVTEEIETAEESEKWIENDIIEERMEDEAVEDWVDDETVENWTEENLKEFEEVGERLTTEVLRWHDGAAKSIRAVYTGNSRTTVWRKKDEKKRLSDDAKGMKTLDNFFKNTEIRSSETLHSLRSSPFPSSSPFPEITQNPLFSVDNLHKRLEEINQQCLITKSVKKNKELFTYDHLRRLSIRRFIQLLLDGQGKMDASNNIAQAVWNKGELLVYRQGKHTKLWSLINDEDFKNECQVWLRQQTPESRSPTNLKKYIEETVFPKLTGHIKKETISEKTCRNYMHFWGYKYDEKKKGVYYDGHERPDVVEYRKEWLKRMFEYKKSMKDFDGDMLDVVLEPQLKPEEKEIDEDILRSKHIGRSIMVSAFLCPCYGLLQLSDEQLQKSEHMLDQLVHQAIPIFEILHPGCTGVFCFDQSTNHNAMAGDALVATKMNLSPGGKQPKMRDGWYINEYGEKCIQSMIFPDNHHLKGQPKGIKQVLKERNLWPMREIRLTCEQCSGKCDDVNLERVDCCARRIMSLQPDFCEQRSILEEAIIKAEHIFERYPKFHCEYLMKRVPEVLVSVPITTIRKFARKSWRYMDAYDKGLEGRTAEWAVSKYKSHRRLHENIENLME
ncbi:hypothetical protein PHYBLDRAFT_144584 [Rhizophagus clarus]|uniref:Uncharacterized protein n=1 Tax=Rhizophagus clarus TaxID=94130 RepID=A0A8H3M777_9GLOM|nr:hypothetical protein PHYBLDRAFT_144584 [Rhizophagus clarus]